MHKHQTLTTQFRKSVLATAIASTVAVTSIPSLVNADVYTWKSNISDDVTFTMLNSVGAALVNPDVPGRGANQSQTPVTGTFTYDDINETGSATISSFLFFGSTAPAEATGIDINKIPVGQNDGTDNLLLANMLFDWGGSTGIPVSLVWNAQGVLDEMATPTTFALNADGSINGTPTALSGSGATPGSDGTYINATFGYLNAGPTPLASTEYNLTAAADCGTDLTSTDYITGTGCMNHPASGVLPLINPDTAINKNRPPYDASYVGTGTGIGGVPMWDGPFGGFNANFDFNNMTLASFTDETPPVVTMGGSATVDLNLNDVYVDPIFSATPGDTSCTDAAPLNTDLNAAIVRGGTATYTGGTTVDTSVAGTFTITYSCTDTAIPLGKSVTAVGDGSTTVTVTLTDHGVSTGTNMTIAGATGDSDINGTFAVTVIDPDTFTYTALSAVDAGTETPASNLVSVVGDGSTTVTVTDTAHGITTGTNVKISGATDDTDINGTFPVTVTDANTYTYTAYNTVDAATEPSSKSVTSAVGDGSTTVTITQTAHGFSSGAIVTMAGATGDTDINGTFTITYINANSYIYTALAAVDAGTEAGAVTAIGQVSAVPQVTATRPSNFNNHTLTRTININTIPVANANYDQTLASDGTLVIDFTTTDLTGGDKAGTDADADSLTFTNVAGTSTNGTVGGNGTNSLLYTPDAGFNGLDSFTYTVNDGKVDSASGTVNLDVTNVLPVAVIDGNSAAVNQLISIDVRANDTDYEDDINTPSLATSGTIGNVTAASCGTAGAVTGGSIAYTAPATIPGGNICTFTYTVTDSDTGVSSPATVTVTILAAPNAVPVALDVDYNTEPNTPLNITFASADDTGGDLPATDGDGDTLIFTNITGTSANGGTITGNNSGTLTYTPATGYSDDLSPDTFTFTADDSKGGVSGVQTVSITVNEVAPVANDDSGSTLLSDGGVIIDVLANDTDIDGATPPVTPAATVTLINDDGGNAVVNPDGTVTYTPVSVGIKTFTYQVTDVDTKISNTATATITVTAIPVTSDQAFPTNEDTPLGLVLASSAVATDDDGDAMTYNTFDATSTQGGTVTINGPQDTLTYTPVANFNGADTFTFSVSDGTNVSTGTSTITINVAPIDDPMVCQGANLVTSVDVPLPITESSLVGSCTDIDGTVTFAGFTAPVEAGATVVDDFAGTLTYTPPSGFSGADSFDFTASDGTVGGDNTYTVSILVSNALALANHDITSSNFTMMTGPGDLAGGGATNISGVFDDGLICDTETCTDFAFTTTLSTDQEYQAAPWTAHDIRVFGPGNYSFDTACSGTDIAAGTTNCGGTDPLTLVVADGQLGAHMLFNWGAVAGTACGQASCDIDVAVLWDYNAPFGDPIWDGDCANSKPECNAAHTGSKLWNWVSVDGNNDGIPGIPMVDGPFVGFNANFNLDMADPFTPPVASDDNIGILPTVLSNLDILANDSDAEDGAPLTTASVSVTLATATSTAGGTLTLLADGTVDYTPPGSLVNGDTDTFQYTVTDSGNFDSTLATVTVTVTSNAPPVANAVAFTAVESTPLAIDVTDLDDIGTALATDAESDPLTFAIVSPTTVQGGTVTTDVTNTIMTYTPPTGYNGADSFTFSVNDGIQDSNVVTVSLTVDPVNDAVVCNDVSLATAIDTALPIDVAATLIVACTDADGDPITFVSADAATAASGTVADDSAGTLTFTPATAFEGPDSFDFTVTDGIADTTATVNVSVGTVFSNFTMLNAAGDVFGGTNDVVHEWDDAFNTGTGDTDFSHMTITSQGPEPFFGAPWFAHHIRVFDAGTYTIETDNTLCENKGTTPDTTANGSKKAGKVTATSDDINVTGCPGTAGDATAITFTVAAGQVGVHMLFDYNGTFDIDVVNLYDVDAVWDDPTGQGDDLNDLNVSSGAGTPPDVLTTWELVSRDVNGDGINGQPMLDGPFKDFYANFNKGPAGVATGCIGTAVKNPTTGICEVILNIVTGDDPDTATSLGTGMLSLLSLFVALPLISMLRRRKKI